MKFGIGLLSLRLVVIAVVAIDVAQADDEIFDIHNKTYLAECGGSCHVAYPPQLLPAASWRSVMGTLDRHFGTDASLDPRQSAAILDDLVARSGKRDAVTADGKPILRISETAWFRREHDELSATVWGRPVIKSAANCVACHRNAEAGDYRERSLRIPK